MALEKERKLTWVEFLLGARHWVSTLHMCYLFRTARHPVELSVSSFPFEKPQAQEIQLSGHGHARKW